MKAAVYEKYGPPEVVHLKDVPRPSPKDDELLIKVRATTVSTADWRVRSLDVPPGFGLVVRLVIGISRPRQPILGRELAGDVEAVGKSVRKFKVGDKVILFTGGAGGCHAEYKAVGEDAAVTLKPDNLTYEEAAAISFGGTTALHFLRSGKLQSGETILIVGASGCVGSAAVQIAKHYGAHVTAVTSTANVDLVKSLGADEVIDYKEEDFTRNGRTYDAIMDTTGTAPFSRSRNSLKRGGRHLQVLGSLGDMLRAPWVSMTSDKKIIAGTGPEREEDVRLLAQLAAAGEFKPVIDRRYPLEQIVEAHRYVDQGHKRGSVVVTLA